MTGDERVVTRKQTTLALQATARTHRGLRVLARELLKEFSRKAREARKVRAEVVPLDSYP